MRSGRLPSSLGLTTRNSVDLRVPETSSEDAGQRMRTFLCACIP